MFSNPKSNSWNVWIWKKRLQNFLVKSIQNVARRRIQQSGVYRRSDLKREASVIEFGSEESVKPRIHHFIGEMTDGFKNDLAAYSTPKPFVAALKQVTLESALALPRTQERKWITEPIYDSEYEIARALRLSAVQKLRGQTLAQQTIKLDIATSLITPYSGNYYHWLIDCLPRLEGVRLYEQRVGRKIPIIVEHPLPAFKRRSLELLGFGEQLFFWKAGMKATCETFVLPSSVNPMFYIAPSSCKWVSENLAREIAPPLRAKPKLIYATRARAAARRVANEDELIQELARFDVECCALEEMTLDAQIRLFQESKVIIAPTGAGLTNMIFSSNAHIIELFDHADMGVWFVMLAAICGHAYHFVVGETVWKKEIHEMIINPKHVADILERILPSLSLQQID
jgi:capsular polysaccharide biosynthesis protein